MGLLTFSINGGRCCGRVTYEMMESYWPAVARGDQEAALAMHASAAKLEAKPKYVVSSTREDFPWTTGGSLAGDAYQAIPRRGIPWLLNVASKEQGHPRQGEVFAMARSPSRRLAL